MFMYIIYVGSISTRRMVFALWRKRDRVPFALNSLELFHCPCLPDKRASDNLSFRRLSLSESTGSSNDKSLCVFFCLHRVFAHSQNAHSFVAKMARRFLTKRYSITPLSYTLPFFLLLMLFSYLAVLLQYTRIFETALLLKGFCIFFDHFPEVQSPRRL